MRSSRLLLILILLVLETGSFAQGISARKIFGNTSFTIITCNTTISSGANLSSSISGMTAGNTLCLNNGTYSTGTTLNNITKSPRVTIISVSGQGATISGLSITGSTSGLTFNNLVFTNNPEIIGTTGTGGSDPHDLTFTYVNINNTTMEVLDIQNGNILFDHITTNDLTTGGTPCCRFIVEENLPRTNENSGVTVQYSQVFGGNTDGLRFDMPGTLQYNEIKNVYEVATPNHTDSFQCFECADGLILRGNYIHQDTDATANYDGSTNITYVDNIVDMTGSPNGTRPWGLEAYAAEGAKIYHNTLLYQSQCDPGYGTIACGLIDIGTKGPAAGNIEIYDNIATSIGIAANQTVTRQDHNLLRSGATGSDISGAPTYTGGSFPTTAAGFVLTAGSLGHLAASDGTDIGSRYFGPYYSYAPNPLDLPINKLIKFAPEIIWLLLLLIAFKKFMWYYRSKFLKIPALVPVQIYLLFLIFLVPVNSVNAQTVLLENQPITLANNFISSKWKLDPLTSSINVKLKRPTTLQSLDWDNTQTLRVSIVQVLDGIEKTSTSQFTGGIYLNEQGKEIPEAIKHISPTVQARIEGTKQIIRWNNKDYLQLTRIGETAKISYELFIRLDLLLGSPPNLELTVETEELPASTIEYHHSVAFDAATDAQDTSGDGVITLTLDPVGTTDLAAFAGSGNSGSTGSAGSSTYAGVTMTELWDQVFATNFAHAGYALAGIPSTSQSVVNTVSSSRDEHIFGVISFTGVHQTTPAGTAVFTNGTTGPASDTVTDMVSGDIVVDNLYTFTTVSITEGADQTVRNTENIVASQIFGAQSTQNGSAGGVMSWTLTTGVNWGHGAVTIKQSSGTTPRCCGGSLRGIVQ